MKQFLDKLVSRAGVRWTLVALATTAAAASIAWSNQGEGRIKLGGSWVLNWLGFAPCPVTLTPLDSTGKQLALHVEFHVPGADQFFEAVTGQAGLQHGDGFGELEQTGKDTWAGKYMVYVTTKTTGGELVFTIVDHLLVQAMGETLSAQHHIVYYWATDDQDHDGFPDPGSVPMVDLGPSTSVWKRIGAGQ